MENIGNWSKCAFAFTVCLTVSSCSPYVYSEQVGKYNTAVSNLRSNYSATAESINNDSTLKDHMDWLIIRPELKLGLGCTGTAPKANPCALTMGSEVPTAPGSPPAERRDPKKDPKKDPNEILKVLNNYTAALVSLTNAEDSAAFDAAASKASTAVSSLAAAADLPLSAVIKPAGNFLFWLIGQKLDYDRLQALHETITAADPSIQVLSVALKTSLSGQNEKQQGNLLDLLGSQIKYANILATRKSNSDANYSTALDAAQATAARFAAVHTMDMEAVASSVGQAHTELKVAIMSNDGQWSALEGSFETLIDNVSALVKAANPPPVAPATKSGATE
ncbi:hypothetical protein GE253_23480 [Niveispirillum sp. SYP-B3756]|uniref:hypothetical protein n=1 Tax=Niveispirillum sp. SYP-B3756 TaxID=2662178 RepID=UPI001292A537|nr:hypothetical protein [Niveispirillum sp. SYP-B3756]MQP68285.1 hypothetical protein [Niveispirillum sp. SYP-B3756]